MQTKSAYCGQCDELRKAERNAPNHLLHFVLSIFTAGIWLIPWFLLANSPRPWRCATCGSAIVPGAGFARSAGNGLKEPVSIAHIPLFIAFAVVIGGALYLMAR